MRKKLFTFLLALVTSVGLMNAAVDDSGSCGDNVTYSFNGTTGAMTITGTGPMTDYASISNVPWNSYRDDITSVTITDGVTTVGSNSFGYHENLVTVTIGNDVETIGYYAFGDCYKFTTLNLGNSVRHIGGRAFMWAKVLTGFTLPSTLETIGERAFLQNKVITSLTIPSNVTSIGESAFFYCAALTSITTEATTPPTLGATVFEGVPTSIPLYVPSGSVAAYEAAAQWNAFNIQGYDPAPTPANVCGDGLTWELSEGVLTISYDGVGTGEMYDFGYEYDQNPVNVAPWKENKSAITTVIVGDGVKSIGNYAFNDLGENFTAVTIANSVERIGVFAFTNSEEITEITLPSSLKTIDERGFANCGFTSITIPSGVTSIGYQAFSYCRGLTSLTCEATTPPTLASGVFYKITSKTSDMSNIHLYVPSESVAAYEAADQWNAFDVQAISGGDPQPVVNLKLIEFQVPASWENDNTPISSADFPDFVATTYEIASALPVTSEPSLVVFDFPGDDEVSVYSKMGGQVSKSSTGAIYRKTFFENTQVHYYYPVLAGEPEPTPTVWTALQVGDVIKVGDKIEVPAEGDGSWGINGNVLRNAWGPYTLIRADIYQASEFDDPVVTETEDGAFYVFKAENSNFYPLSYLGKGTGLVVTMTSDGLVVTAAENKEFTVAVHENGSTPTAVENVQTNHVQATKILRNGQLLIERDGKTYNIIGTMIQ